MTPSQLLLYWSEHFLQEEDPSAALLSMYPRQLEASDRVVLSPAQEAHVLRLVLRRRDGEATRLQIDFIEPVRLDWAALQKEYGPLVSLQSTAGMVPVYRLSLHDARCGYLLLETTPEELPRAKVQSATIERFPARELGGAIFQQEALFRLLSAFQASDFSLTKLFHWFGNPQQEDDESAQLLPYQGANVYHLSCTKEADNKERVSRIDLHLLQPIEVTRSFFSQKMLTITGPNEAMLSAAPVYVYQANGNAAEVLLTVEGQWSQDSQRVKSLILRKANRRQAPAEPQRAPTARRGAVATQPAIDLSKLPLNDAPSLSSLSPRKASTEEVARNELEQTRDASKMTNASVVLPPRLVAVYKGQRYHLEQEEFIIGRGKNSHLEIPDPDLSRKHATVKKQGELYYIEDHSINGVRYQGIKIKRKEIKPGDTFFLCEHEIQFVLERPKGSVES